MERERELEGIQSKFDEAPRPWPKSSYSPFPLQSWAGSDFPRFLCSLRFVREALDLPPSSHSNSSSSSRYSSLFSLTHWCQSCRLFTLRITRVAQFKADIILLTTKVFFIQQSWSKLKINAKEYFNKLGRWTPLKALALAHTHTYLHTLD